MSTLKTGALRGTSGTADSIQLHASNQSVTFPGAVTITGALTSSTTGLGGLSEVDEWMLKTNPIGDEDPITGTWARRTGKLAGKKGTGMTESSGVFTFPSTGYWRVTFRATYQSQNDHHYIGFSIKATDDNGSNWDQVAENYVFIHDNDTSNNVYASAAPSVLLDIEDVSNDKVSFKVNAQDGTEGVTLGHSGGTLMYTSAHFEKYGDT